MKPIRTTAPTPAAPVAIRSRRSPKRSRRRLPPRSSCVIGTTLIAAHANAQVGARSGPLPDCYQSHTSFQPTAVRRRASLRSELANGEERHVKRMSLVALAVVVFAAWTGLAAASSQKASLTGAGSTFVAPLVSQWISHYSTASINYSGVGSGAGIAAISGRQVDFGASDAPMTPDQFAGCHGCVQIPWAFSATSIPYNISGLGYGLKLTGPILANIYLGHIKKWNDKRIRAINRGVHLPSEDIVPIYRSDGSGTSYNFTDYLSRVSREWKRRIGKSTQPAFPAGVG